MSFKIIEKVFVICQSKKMSILLRKSLVFWLYDILKRYLYREQKN